jgi:DNA-binding CsgD family transcriptional regulator
MTIDSPDLRCLNAAEREALALLAVGHTAKSIATLTGRSEGAINERLRDARRKTGVGSSRELARLLRQQENRDEVIGVASPDVANAHLASPAGGLDRHFPKVVAMIALLPIIGALFLGVHTTLAPPQATSTLPTDPLIDSAIGSPNDTPQATRKQFLAEPRDPVWAPRTEAALATAYRTINGLAPELRIRCASTLCEVVGQTMRGSSSALSRTMKALQGQSLMKRLSANGLSSISQSFSGPTRTSIVFVAYWTSAKP